MDNLTEPGAINFALPHMKDTQASLMKTIKALSSTGVIEDFSFARIAVLADLGNTINEILEEMEQELEMSNEDDE